MEKELRILILEDVPADAELEEHELKKAGLVFTSKVVDTEDTFLKALEEYFPDIILADYDLPAFDGIEALKIAKEKCPEVPFILVTGRVGEEFAIETLKKGVADYVMKGNLKRLVPSISRAIYDAKLVIQRKQSEEKFRLLAEQSPNMIFINYRGRVVYVNQKCEEVMGYTRDEFYSESFDFRNLIAPEYLDLVSSSFQKHMQGEEVPPYEYAILSKDGKRIEVIITTKLIDYENEKAILGTITDITKRKQAEETIHLEMKFTETLLESLPGLFYLYELDLQSPANSRLIRFNRKHSTLTGYTPEELENMTIKDWFEPDMLAKVVRVIRLIGKRRETQANLKLRMKDGSQVPYAFTGRLLKIHDKMYFLGTGIDISDVISAHKALRESEEKHRLVVENAHDAIIILQDGKIKFHNHQSIALSGYSEEEIKSVPFSSFIHTDDKDMVMERHRKRLLGENIPSTYSFRFINKKVKRYGFKLPEY